MVSSYAGSGNERYVRVSLFPRSHSSDALISSQDEGLAGLRDRFSLFAVLDDERFTFVLKFGAFISFHC